jgi:hypothetical protein
MEYTTDTTTTPPAKRPRRERNHALVAQLFEEMQAARRASGQQPATGDSLRNLSFAAPCPDHSRATFAPPAAKAKKSGAAYKRIREERAAAQEAERQKWLTFIAERKAERAKSK